MLKILLWLPITLRVKATVHTRPSITLYYPLSAICLLTFSILTLSTWMPFLFPEYTSTLFPQAFHLSLSLPRRVLPQISIWDISSCHPDHSHPFLHLAPHSLNQALLILLSLLDVLSSHNTYVLIYIPSPQLEWMHHEDGLCYLDRCTCLYVCMLLSYVWLCVTP